MRNLAYQSAEMKTTNKLISSPYREQVEILILVQISTPVNTEMDLILLLIKELLRLREVICKGGNHCERVKLQIIPIKMQAQNHRNKSFNRSLFRKKFQPKVSSINKAF